MKMKKSIEELVREIAQQVEALEKRMDSPVYGEYVGDPDDEWAGHVGNEPEADVSGYDIWCV